MPTTLFRPVYIGRSDGKTHIATSGSRSEPNAPPASQQDPRTNTKGKIDFFRPLNSKDGKHIDWRRKLAGMLMRELGKDDKKTPYILAEFPENFVLYERVKSINTAKLGSAETAERSDSYLYGHPFGPKKRYRSPADFFPHLLWLVTDSQGDTDNCSCKLCCPNDTLIEEDPAKKRAKDSSQKEATSAKAKKASASTAVKPNILPQTSAIGPGRTMAAICPPVQPSALVKSMSVDQDLDLQYGVALYRQGEVVWFDRGVSWGLGVVTQRNFSSGPSSKTNGQVSYVVQPLSHPGKPLPQVTLEKTVQLRPWLTWSAPSFTHAGLNSVQNLRYEITDWEAVMRGAYGPGDMQVDASILAARMVDRSFTMIEPLASPSGNKNPSERRWNGIFLGAEKIWVGEAVRLVNSDASLLVVQEIVERPSPDNSNGGLPIVEFIGDAYIYSSIPVREKPATLPHRVWEDLTFRTSMPYKRSGGVSRPQVYMKLCYSRYRISINSIRGRWYESSLLLPIICKGGEWDQKIVNGDIDDCSKWLNPKAPPTKLTATRRETLGGSVPQDFAIYNFNGELAEPRTTFSAPQPPQMVAPTPVSSGGAVAQNPISVQQQLHVASSPGGQLLAQGAGNKISEVRSQNSQQAPQQLIQPSYPKPSVMPHSNSLPVQIQSAQNSSRNTTPVPLISRSLTPQTSNNIPQSIPIIQQQQQQNHHQQRQILQQQQQQLLQQQQHLQKQIPNQHQPHHPQQLHQQRQNTPQQQGAAPQQGTPQQGTTPQQQPLQPALGQHPLQFQPQHHQAFPSPHQPAPAAPATGSPAITAAVATTQPSGSPQFVYAAGPSVTWPPAPGQDGPAPAEHHHQFLYPPAQSLPQQSGIPQLPPQMPSGPDGPASFSAAPLMPAFDLSAVSADAQNLWAQPQGQGQSLGLTGEAAQDMLYQNLLTMDSAGLDDQQFYDMTNWNPN